MSDLQTFIDEAKNGLAANMETLIANAKDDLTEEKEIMGRFATHIGSLNYRIFMGERVETSAKALEMVLEVGVDALRMKLRYKIEEAVTNTFFAGVGTFVKGVLAFAVAAGKSYLQSQELGILETIRNKVENI